MRTPQSEIREDRSLIHMRSDLLRAPLSGDVLGLGQRGPSRRAGERDEILCNHRHRAARAFLPRWVFGGLDDHLADHPPAGVVGVAASDQKPRERIGNGAGFRIGGVTVQVSERDGDLPALFDSPAQFPRCRLPTLWSIHLSTVLTRLGDMPIPRFLKGRVAKEEAILIDDPRVADWESVGMFEDRATAVSWRDQLRSMGVDACCTADHPLDNLD